MTWVAQVGEPRSNGIRSTPMAAPTKDQLRLHVRTLPRNPRSFFRMLGTMRLDPPSPWRRRLRGGRRESGVTARSSS